MDLAVSVKYSDIFPVCIHIRTVTFTMGQSAIVIMWPKTQFKLDKHTPENENLRGNCFTLAAFSNPNPHIVIASPIHNLATLSLWCLHP